MRRCALSCIFISPETVARMACRFATSRAIDTGGHSEARSVLRRPALVSCRIGAPCTHRSVDDPPPTTLPQDREDQGFRLDSWTAPTHPPRGS